MEKIILGMIDQLKAGYELGSKNKIQKDYHEYVIAGIGGSSVPGEILWMLFSEQNKNQRPKVFVNRDYGLPAWMDNQSLVVCISWSGETEETISAFNQALANKLDTLVIAKGGRLLQLAKEHNTPSIELPNEDYPARFGIGYQLGALMGALGLEIKISEPSQDQIKEIAQGIASKIGQAYPLVYSSFQYRKLANLWKTLFNENAKVPAFWNTFPSLNHNELESLKTGQGKLFPIIFRSSQDSQDINRNIDGTIAILEEMGYNYSVVNISSTSSLLEQILSNYILGLWTSFYLAKNLGVEIEATPIINEYKKLKK